jgi:caffeoyl-CoA O-methyltransferase
VGSGNRRHPGSRADGHRPVGCRLLLPYDATMTDIVEPSLERYATEHTTAPPPFLEALAEDLRATLDFPGMMVGRLEGRFLEMLTFALGARSVLEIGTFGGYSALAMAAGLAPGGRITSCEISPTHADFARRHIAASPYVDLIEVLVGPAIDTIATLEGPFDLVFIDADKAAYSDYFEAVLPKLAPRGLIAADNTLWSGQILDPSDSSEDTVALRRFNDALAVDPRVVVVQTTVRDGVTLIRPAG